MREERHFDGAAGRGFEQYRHTFSDTVGERADCCHRIARPLVLAPLRESPRSNCPHAYLDRLIATPRLDAFRIGRRDGRRR